MATKYFVGTGNWNDTNRWSLTSGGTGGAGVPTINGSAASADAVVFDANSGNCTVNAIVGGVSQGIQSLTFSGYTSTITMSNNIHIAAGGSFVLDNLAIATSGTSPVYCNNAITLTSTGGSWGGNMSLSGAATSTKTMTSDFIILGSLNMVSGSTAAFTGGYTLTCAGYTSSAVQTGDVKFKFTGGIWSGSSTISADIEFAGNVTVSGSVTWSPTTTDGTSTLKYTSGTIDTSGSTISTTLTTSTGITIFDTAGITWNNMAIANTSGATTIYMTINSDLAASGNITFTTNGAANFTFQGTNTFNMTGNFVYTSAQTYTFTLGMNTYIGGITKTSGSVIFNGYNLTLSGGTLNNGASGTISGTTNFLLTGGGIWTSTGGGIKNNIEFTGNYTVSGTVLWTPTAGASGYIRYTSGTINTTGSTLSTALTATAADTTFDTSTMVWDAVTFNNASNTNSKVTLTSDLRTSGLFTLSPIISTTFIPSGTGAIRAGSWYNVSGLTVTLNTDWYINTLSFNSSTFNTNKVYINTLFTPATTSSTIGGTTEFIMTAGSLTGLGASSAFNVNITLFPDASTTVSISGGVRVSGTRTLKATLTNSGASVNTGTSSLTILSSNYTLDTGGVSWYDCLILTAITINVLSQWTIAGTMTLRENVTISSSGGSSPTYWNPTGTLECGITSADVSITVQTNVTVQNLTIIHNSAGTNRTRLLTNTINITNSLTISNNNASAAGSTILNFSGSGSGNWSGNFTVNNPITFNKTGGVLTIGASLANNSIKYGGTSMTYTSGTIDASTYSSTLALLSSATLAGFGSISWYNLSVSSAVTLTINTSELVWTNLFTITASLTLSSSGVIGFTGRSMNITYSGSNITLTLKAATTYSLSGTLTLLGGTSSSNLSVVSSTTTHAKMPLYLGGSQTVRYVTATYIDSSGGQTIWNYKGTNTNTINWNLLTAPPTVSQTFVY